MPFSKGTYMRKLLALIGLSLLSLSFAHQEIKVGDEYVMFCGNRNEPYYAGMVGGLDLYVNAVAKEGQEEGDPISGAEKSLVVEIIAPSGTTRKYTGDGGYDPNSLWEVTWEAPGQYATSWVLAEPGQYKVHITGFIGETPVDAYCDNEETWKIGPLSDIEIR
jgi:hypothetical protein